MPATARLLPLPLLLVLALAAGAPVRYDQRQEGDFNVHAHLENFVVVLIPTSGGGGGGLGIIDMLKKAGATVRTAQQPLQDGPSPNGTPQDQHSPASKSSEVAVVGVPPKDQEQSKADPQLEPQQQREAEGEELQAAGSQAVEAVLVAESPALVLARAQAPPPGQQQPAAQQHQRERDSRAMAGRADGCPQGQFRDATGVCHHVGSDQRVGEQFYFGLEPPLDN